MTTSRQWTAKTKQSDEALSTLFYKNVWKSQAHLLGCFCHTYISECRKAHGHLLINPLAECVSCTSTSNMKKWRSDIYRKGSQRLETRRCFFGERSHHLMPHCNILTRWYNKEIILFLLECWILFNQFAAATPPADSVSLHATFDTGSYLPVGACYTLEKLCLWWWEETVGSGLLPVGLLRPCTQAQ